MPSRHLILCRPLLLPPSIFPSIRGLSQWVHSSHQVAKVLGFQLQHQPFQYSPEYSQYSGLISFRMDWLDLLAVQGTLKSLLQHHSSKASGLYYPGSTFTFRELLMVTNPSSSLLPLLIQEGLWEVSFLFWNSFLLSLGLLLTRVEEQDFSQPLLNVGDVTRPQGWRFMPLSDHHLSNLLETKDARPFKIHGPNISKRKGVRCPFFSP